MLFKQQFLDGIRDGRVTVAFRRWRRPSVRAGGALLTPAGQLSITSVTATSLEQISAADARRAGYDSLDALLAELRRVSSGIIYRIELGPLGPDPRIGLRESVVLREQDRRRVHDRLDTLDSRSPTGAWTRRTLELIGSRPGVRAGDLCGLVGQEKADFKRNVRKLKNLGLTESLGTGYRLSSRGQEFMKDWRQIR